MEMSPILVTLALSIAAPVQEPATPAPPLRVLALLGGEHHPYEAGAKALFEGLRESGLAFTLESVRIDDPPEGLPRAEKATLPRRADLLLDPALRDRFDVLFQFTQDSYLEKLGSDHVDAILRFVRSGGGWVGTHSASDTFKAYPEFIRMVGGRFETHPPYGKLRIERLAVADPVGEGIGDFEIEDELYHLADCPSDGKNLFLVTRSPADGKLRPVAWTRRYGSGRVFYTALGHGVGTYQSPIFRRMLRQAFEWVRPAPRAADGSIALFDGKTHDGWAQSGPGRFVVENGELVAEGGMGLLWFTERPFADFELSLEWNAPRREDNSGVFVRFPSPENPWTAVNAGYEIQICDAAPPGQNTGSVYSFQEPKSVPTKEPGQWNRMVLEVRGQTYRVKVNGVPVNEFEGTRALDGFLGLQNHDPQSRVRFRDVRARDLR